VRNSLASKLDGKIDVLRLDSHRSHLDAKLFLNSVGSAFVVIFAHGGTDYIRGGEYRDRLDGSTCVVERFLERSDLHVFHHKVVFCLSCQSKELASDALKAGALAFVGFDQIPYHRIDARGVVISDRRFNQHSQGLIANAISVCLGKFLFGNYTLDRSVEFMRLWICQNAFRVVRDLKSDSSGQNIAALLLKVKDGLCYSGKVNIRFSA
jgi:hypothetical protein